MSASARWLVLGAGGQLGRSFLAAAPGRGLTAVGRTHKEVDVCDEGAVARALAEVQPHVVLNAAAHTGVDDCETEEELAEAINGRAPEQLAHACGSEIRLIHLSTEYVFDGTTPRPLAEDAPTAPLSAYGRTKLAGERGVLSAPGDHLVVRTQWLFGQGPNFVRTMLRLARGGGPLRVVEDQIGRPTSTDALAGALVEAHERGVTGVLHLACEGVASWYDFALRVVDEAVRRGRLERVPVEPVPTEEFPRPAPRPAYAVLDLGRARSVGIRLPHWTDALGAYLDAEEEAL